MAERGVQEMNKDELKQRTKQYALQIIKLVESLPKGLTAEVLSRQLLRSGTSFGANCRLRNTDFRISFPKSAIRIPKLQVIHRVLLHISRLFQTQAWMKSPYRIFHRIPSSLPLQA